MCVCVCDGALDREDMHAMARRKEGYRERESEWAGAEKMTEDASSFSICPTHGRLWIYHPPLSLSLPEIRMNSVPLGASVS